MTKPFNIEPTHITLLNEYQLTQLLKLLLHAEADKHGIAQRSVDVALNIKVGDGGEDGRIEWQGEPESTDYLPYRLTQFQNKATEMGVADCANELVTKKGLIKPMVADVLKQSGTYILFLKQELNQQQKQERITAMKAKLKDLGFANANIDIYDASKIAGWVNCFLPAIISVLTWIGRPIERGLKPFSLWETVPEFTEFPFIDIVARKQIITDVKSLLKQTQKCGRIVGLSGLGKTRTAFEVFKDDDFLKELVVYADAAIVTNISGLVADWVSNQIHGVIVIDNCDIRIHEILQNEVSRTDSKLSLLTLDYNFEKTHSAREFRLEPFSITEIKEMLEKTFGGKIPDLERIAEFAQGFPQMAVLIAQARLDNDPNLGSLTDDVIAEKLLWSNSNPQNDKDEKILKSCALFNTFGMDQEASSEYEFISSKISAVPISEFFDCIQRFTERGIIDRRGRYAQLIPKPLAIRLAAQWWKRTHEQDQTELINSLPESLVESFCKQIEKLDFLPEVKGLTATLCGQQGPFGQAEVILSNRGSRLFRSFVNVNPDATNSSLTRILKNKPYEELLGINGDVRRNIVWALENLCFHAHLFEDAAWSLLLLASAENESYGNNAIGIFAQLFRIRGSGTASTPEKRFFVLKRAIERNNDHFSLVVLKALESGISTYGGFRTIGAEYQGTKAPLEEWKPLIWQEIFDYWQSCFDILVQLVEKESQISEHTKYVIGHSIRGLVQNGRIEMLDKAIKQVISTKGKFWPSALESIKNALEYDTEKMPQVGINALNSWLELLTPDQTSIEERLKILVVFPTWEHREDSHGQFVDVAKENAEKFANEISKNIQSINEHLDLLLTGEQRQTFTFGKALAMKVDCVDEILQLAIALLPKFEYPNINFILGLLAGIYQKSVDCWNKYIDIFTKIPKLTKFYPEVICTGIIDTGHLFNLLSLIKDDQLSLRSVIYLSYGSVTKHLTANDISSFCLELAKIDPDGSWVALDIIFMYCYGDNDKFVATKETLKSIVTSVPLNNRFRGGHSDMYHWEEVIKKLLGTEELDFASAVCKQIIAAADDKLEHVYIWDSIKPTLIEIMSKYGKELWPIFADAIILADPIKRYWLQCLLERENGFSTLKESVLSIIPFELIIEWCKENPNIAPYFVARTINIFDQNDDGSKQPSKLFIALLENFGDLDSLGSEFSANLGTRGWTGSLVPYLESDKLALTPLCNHTNHNVRSWVREYIDYLEKAIAYEKSRDDEHVLGIY